ncbi:MAG: hypothetical protein WDM90_04715 [Ferruginibacter sp.]
MKARLSLNTSYFLYSHHTPLVVNKAAAKNEAIPSAAESLKLFYDCELNSKAIYSIGVIPVRVNYFILYV